MSSSRNYSEIKDGFDFLTVFNFVIKFDCFNSKTWQGVCLDTRVQKTIIGLNYARVSCKYMSSNIKASRSSNKYKFRIDQQVAIGSIAKIISFPNNTILIEQVDVNNTEIPFLLCFDFLDKYSCMQTTFLTIWYTKN